MTVHRVALRAGVVTAMAAALLAGLLTAPAQAQPGPDVRLAGIGNIELRVGGGEQTVTIRVENRSNGDPLTSTASGVRVTMSVPLTEFGVHIPSASGGCNRSNNDTFMECALPDVPPGQSQTVTAQIGVQGNSQLQAGETRNGTAQVAVSTGAQTSFNVRLQGPERQQTVANVSGIVTDQNTGEGIDGAKVFLTDSQGRDFDTTTNANGEFSFRGDEIAPGAIGLQASKDGYESRSITENAQPGQSLTGLQLVLVNTAAPTTAPPTTAPPTTEPPSVAPPVQEASSGGGGTFTTIMIILGILFVLLGIGAIVFLIIRRRREQDDEGPEGADDPTSGPRGPGPVPGSHGVYRPTPTQVMGPRGPIPAVGPQPALANAQTMMQPRAGAADETALLPRAGDPTATRPMGPRPPVAGSPPPPRTAAPTYGSPANPAMPYDNPPGRHGGSPPDRYGDETQVGRAYGSPASQRGGGYGSPAGRHDQGGGYGSPSHDNSSSYGPDPYAQPQPSYDQRDYRGGGGGYSGGYDRPAPPDHRGGGGYGGSDQGGYGGQSYGRSGYGQPGYREDPAGPQRGYGTDYQEPTPPRSRHAAEPPEPPERRRLDWLDQ